MLSQPLIEKIAVELGLPPRQVARALELFEEGNTLPFIARYRKEATGGLDEVQLAAVRDRGQYLAELEERRAAILASIEEQGKLDAELRARIEAAETKQALEDLYLPYRPKRRTRATIARERGLEPLAELIWAGQATDAEVEAAAASFVDEGREVPSTEAALQGARDILAERVAEDADLRGWVRDLTREKAVARSSAVAGKEKEVSKFQDYYDFSEPLARVPSHRILAIRRGEEEGYLTWAIEAPVEEIVAGLDGRVASGRRARAQLGVVVEDAYRRLMAPSIAVELRMELKNAADEEAIAIFGKNLEQLLLASPAGERAVIGLDPGFRTGVKVAAVSRTGAVLQTDTLYLHQPERFAEALGRLIDRYGAELIAIGNGTASRETEALARQVLRGRSGATPQVVVVSESGASVYSASDVARDELPELDVSLRGAVSIARRLQDPLAELVKIDPKSIGVGQYQHDVNQPRLKRRLDEVVEICVNRVGVEVNTASPSLLSYVAGIGATLAQNIVKLRDERGGLRSRRELRDVPRLGERAFEQAAGFLRVRGGEHPLDATAVHPERYRLVERIAQDVGRPLPELLENESLIERIDLVRYVSDDVGLPTLRDIVEELKKPGRDPRETFEPPAFREDVKEPKDLKEGMLLEGVVTNIVAFGAFVDVGVHQDGLVHVSQLADRFVRDPNDVVAVGQKVKVTVLSVDLERNRIALSMRSGAGASGGADRRPERGGRPAAAGAGGGQPGARSGGGAPGRDRSGERRPPAGRDRPQPPAPKPGDIAPNGMRFR
ncbi:MAG TPA: Tex family protein [Longimicrobiales bacterium]|nr:Tex family protein [Longimicrobiales bacterium]